MTILNPIKYTSRDFWSVMNDINSDADLAGTPEWWKRIMAGCVDVASMQEDVIANNFNLRTAFTVQAVRDILKEIDYELTPFTTSSGVLLFYIKRTATFPVIVAKSDLVASSQGSSSLSSKRFEARIGATFTAFSEAIIADPSSDKLTIARTGGYILGDLIRFTTTGTIPAPLVVGVDYYVIPYDVTHIRVATSLVNCFAGIYVDLTSAGSATNALILYSYAVDCYQQTTISPVIIGSSDGVTEWQTFSVPYTYFLRDQITLSINAQTWTRVDDFINSTSTDKVFRVLYRDNNYCDIEFGNGTYGKIPTAATITINGSYGGGSGSNFSAINRINLYAGTDSNISGVTNPSVFTGGSEIQGIESAKILGPATIKTASRFVTAEDGVTLILGYGGVAKAVMNRNFYGPGTARVLYVPDGGGVLSGSVKTALNTYLVDLSILGSATITIIDPNYDSINYVSSFKVLAGYTFAYLKPVYEFGIHLVFSAQTTEIKAMFLDKGVAATIAYTNTLWGFTFDSTYYSLLSSMITAVHSPEFGPTPDGDIYQSDVDVVISIIPGIDYSLPDGSMSFPFTFADDHIAEVGTLTTTEI